MKKSLTVNILLVVVAVVVGYSSFSMARRARSLYRERSDDDVKIKELSEKDEDLKARISEFNTPAVIEREAKARLNLKRQGEEVIVVVPDKNNLGVATSPGLWGKFLRLLNIK